GIELVDDLLQLGVEGPLVSVLTVPVVVPGGLGVLFGLFGAEDGGVVELRRLGEGLLVHAVHGVDSFRSHDVSFVSRLFALSTQGNPVLPTRWAGFPFASSC